MRILSNLVAMVLSLCVGTTAIAQSFDVQAEILIRDNPAKVRASYADELFEFQAILWWRVVGCWGGGNRSVGAKATCLVCSIDSAAGFPYPRTDFRYDMGYNLPSTAVGYHASYAYFSRRPEGWHFERYAPFAARFTARSREPYHRANLNNMIFNAPAVCNELQDVSGYE